MDIINDILPILIVVLGGAYLWWIIKDRNRANTYIREVEHSAEYRASSAEYFKRSVENMERMELALDRIATALENQNDRDG